MGLTGATAHTGCMLRVLFCKADVINHYLCDLFPLLELSCSSTYINEVVVLCFSAFNIFIPILTILSSYIFIISSILQIHSKEGRPKAFSTCSSHISAVAIFYGSAAFMYLQPSSVSSMDHGKVSSVFYTIIVPMLNALIYSLRGPLIFSPVPAHNPGVGNGNLLQCSFLEKSMDRRGLGSCSPWGCEELDASEHIYTPLTIWSTSARTQQFPHDTWLSCLEV